MQDDLIRAAEREYGCDAEERELPVVPEELHAKYASEEWRYGTRIPFSKVIEHRFDWGGVEIQLEMRGEYIQRCRMFSDSLETELFWQIQEMLPGCKYDAGEILGLRLPQGASAAGYEILELIASSIE
jgi:lipoate-protein ligase A